MLEFWIILARIQRHSFIIKVVVIAVYVYIFFLHEDGTLVCLPHGEVRSELLGWWSPIAGKKRV